LGAQSCLQLSLRTSDLEKPSFGPSKWPRKLKTAKNSKLPKLPENCFEPVWKRWVATDIHLDHVEGVDFGEIFSLVEKLTSIRVLMSLAAKFNLEI
jgi:hypothetical protein